VGHLDLEPDPARPGGEELLQPDEEGLRVSRLHEEVGEVEGVVVLAPFAVDLELHLGEGPADEEREELVVRTEDVALLRLEEHAEERLPHGVEIVVCAETPAVGKRKTRT